MKWPVFLTCFFLGGCGTLNIPAVSGFDLRKYSGSWYEIARLPNRFEEGMTQVSAEYTILPDGRCQVVNRGLRDGEWKSVKGWARFSEKNDTGDLEVSFFRPFYSRYRVIKLAPDYRFSVVIGADPGYLWILSRTPELSEKDMTEIITFLKSNAFPVEKMIFR